MVWTFLDFVDARGVNQIKAWLDSVPAKVKAKFNTRLQYLRNEKVLSDAPYTKMLKGEGDGLMEIIFEVFNVQYRPLAFYGPGNHEITILFPAEERSGRFVPRGTVRTAQRRRYEVERNPQGRVCPHDFS